MAKRGKARLEFRGDLQAEVMTAIWKLGEETVDDVHEDQPTWRRSAYTTVQTVLNRLVQRGLLERRREGGAFVYRPQVEESEYLARWVGGRLADASPDARRAALCISSASSSRPRSMRSRAERTRSSEAAAGADERRCASSTR